MSTLICLGLGYSAEHFVAAFGDRFDHIVGTVRSRERAAELNEQSAPRLKVLVFDGKTATPELRQAIGEAGAALISVPQDESGDPVLRACGDAFDRAPKLGSIVYLSTIGVYGDRGGGWVDESSPVNPVSERGRERVDAEQAWREFGKRRGVAVAVLRLAGIYGPGRNAFTQIARGDARRIVKPGQIFNRIHVGDIAQAIDAAFARRADGIFNVADDEPTPSGDPLAFAAQLMGVAPPREIPFAEAAPAMSPLALSFWQECRRVKNDKLKRELGVRLHYPTYREGLRALFESRNRPAPRVSTEGQVDGGSGENSAAYGVSMDVTEFPDKGILWRGWNEETLKIIGEKQMPVLLFVADHDGLIWPFLREIFKALPKNAALRSLLHESFPALFLKADELPPELKALGAGSRFHIAILSPAGLTPLVTFDPIGGSPAEVADEIAVSLKHLR